MLSKTVYFVRHGQSEGNVSDRFQSVESPLNEKGREQAAKIADRLTRIEFETLIASPLTRTKETAEIIAPIVGKEIEFSELFVERRKPTRLIDKLKTDPEAKLLQKEWEESLCASGLRAEDGENYDDLVARADKALAFLASRPEASLVVVTHGFFVRVMMGRVLFGEAFSDQGFRHMKTHVLSENTGITVFKYENTWENVPAWKLWIYNDHAHLG